MTINFSEDPRLYDSLRGEYVTSHSLKDFRNDRGEYVTSQGRKEQEKKAHNLLGEAVHCNVLEGPEVFSSRYILSGVTNPRTEKHFGISSKKHLSHAEEVLSSCGKFPVPDKDFAFCAAARFSAMGHPVASHLLADGKPEVTVRALWSGLKCQSRLDWIHFDEELGLFEKPVDVVDVKTIRQISRRKIDLKVFEYKHQLSFYSRMLELNRIKVDQCHIIFIDKVTAKVEVESFDRKRDLEREDHDNNSAIEQLSIIRAFG